MLFGSMANLNTPNSQERTKSRGAAGQVRGSDLVVLCAGAARLILDGGILSDNHTCTQWPRMISGCLTCQRTAVWGGGVQ
jgi:hypothetical protein